MSDSTFLLGRSDDAAYTSSANCRGFFVALTVFIVLAAAGVSIAALITGNQAAAIQRFCLSDNPTSPTVLGMLQLQSNEREITYRIQYMNLTDVIIALDVYGPIPPGISDGPLAIELCGSYSGIACDTTTEMNVVSGKLLQAEPGGTSLRPIIRAIRQEPYAYYLSVITGAGEEARMYLTSICGTSA